MDNCEDWCDFAPIEQCEINECQVEKKSIARTKEELTEQRRTIYHNDPSYRRELLDKNNIWAKQKRADDPVWKAKRNLKSKLSMRKKRDS